MSKPIWCAACRNDSTPCDDPATCADLMDAYEAGWRDAVRGFGLKAPLTPPAETRDSCAPSAAGPRS